MDLKDNWTIIQASTLLSAYKRFPNLWDSNHKFYKNKALRKNCLKHIAKQVSMVKPTTTINDVRAKLKTLRSQYGKEKRRREIIAAKRGLDDFVPKLWCYDQIKFIDSGVKEDDCDDDSNFNYPITEIISADNTMFPEFLEDDEDFDVPKAKPLHTPRRSGIPNWSKDQTYTLLSLLKKHPILYDSTHPLYANPFHRVKAFREILAELKLIKPKVTIPHIRSKLRTLRSQYLKEKRILRLSKESRIEYVPKLWCFDHMNFLDERGKFLEDEREQAASLQDKELEVPDQPDDCYIVENDNEIYVKSYDDDDSGNDDDIIQRSPETPPHSNETTPCNDFDAKSQDLLDSLISHLPQPPSTPSYTSRPLSVLHQKCLGLVETLTHHMRKHEENSIVNEESSTPQALLGKMVELELLNVSDDVFEKTKWKIIRLLEQASIENQQKQTQKYKESVFNSIY